MLILVPVLLQFLAPGPGAPVSKALDILRGLPAPCDLFHSLESAGPDNSGHFRESLLQKDTVDGVNQQLLRFASFPVKVQRTALRVYLGICTQDRNVHSYWIGPKSANKLDYLSIVAGKMLVLQQYPREMYWLRKGFGGLALSGGPLWHAVLLKENDPGGIARAGWLIPRGYFDISCSDFTASPTPKAVASWEEASRLWVSVDYLANAVDSPANLVSASKVGLASSTLAGLAHLSDEELRKVQLTFIRDCEQWLSCHHGAQPPARYDCGKMDLFAIAAGRPPITYNNKALSFLGRSNDGAGISFKPSATRGGRPLRPVSDLTEARRVERAACKGYFLKFSAVYVNDPVAGLTSMGWDKENRLVLHQQGGSIATYGYSGDNLKRTELVDGSLTTLVWDGSDHLGQIP